MDDITELDIVQAEAKQLRRMEHRNIVEYEDDFVHIEQGTFDPKYYFIILMEYCSEVRFSNLINRVI